MKRIKVVFFAEILIEDFDGASRTMFQLINRIDRTKFEFLFVCGVGPDQILGFECLKIPAITLPLNTNYTMALPALVRNEVKKKLQLFKPDILHISTPSLLGGFALKYAEQHRIPVISIYHTHFISYIDYYLKHTPFLISKVKQMIAEGQKSFYNQCDQIYVPAESIKNELAVMGVELPRMKIWKRGIDTSLFSPLHKDSGLLKRLTGNENPTIIFASRLVWEKNLETLFRIYTKIRDTGFEVNFLVVGDGIAKKASEIKMKDAIFTGKLDHQALAVLYASSSLFLFPSVSETYGNVVLEAMASGLPCVIADGGGSADFIDQGINGFKCEPYSEDDYVEKIMLILKNKELSGQFIDQGLQYSGQLNWEKLAGDYFDDLSVMASRSSLVAV
jgi:glycosyltransferase involved in cell wall biosynthesis